jgi:putative SOS response-associated peptidase YedK
MCASFWIQRAEAEWAEMMEWMAVRSSLGGWVNAEFKKRGEPYGFPGYDVPAVTATADGSRVVNEFRWGFLPPWATSASHKPAPFNARSETVATSGLFKHAFRRNRCLVPAHGFYEWGDVDGKKNRYLFTPESGGPMAFAGIWSDWQGSLRTCTILTTTPNASVAPVHDRMPVLLDPTGMAAWLDPSSDDATLQSLLKPAYFGLVFKAA